VEPWSADRLVAKVERIGARGLPYGQLHGELAVRIRRVLPVDVFCWHGLDSQTRLLTTANPMELMRAGFLTPETEAMAAGAVVTSEYLRDDVNTFAALAARRTPVGVLSETTSGHLSAAHALLSTSSQSVPPTRCVLRWSRVVAPGVRGPAPYGAHGRLHAVRGTGDGPALATGRGGTAQLLPH